MIGKSRGFTLIELMIVVTVTFVMSALAIPAYRGYIDTADMTKVSANLEEAVRLTQMTFTKDKSLMALGLLPMAPSDTDGWIQIFNSSGAEAPGGDPTFMPSSNHPGHGRGNPLTGAIGVKWSPANTGRRPTPAKLELWRPLYKSLVEQRATITINDINIENQRQPSVD
jgi:prepilin-type N-terminal cleavage/methylation domain-containing protein